MKEKRINAKLTYINTLAENKDLEGLKKEEEAILREIDYYNNIIMTTIDDGGKYIEQKQYEEEILKYVIATRLEVATYLIQNN